MAPRPVASIEWNNGDTSQYRVPGPVTARLARLWREAAGAED